VGSSPLASSRWGWRAVGGRLSEEEEESLDGGEGHTASAVAVDGRGSTGQGARVAVDR
jgi:hypothetical protein